LPLRVEVRDGTSGQPVFGASLVLRPGHGVPNFPAGVQSVAFRCEGSGHVLPASPFLGGEYGGYRLDARLPAGYVAESKDSLWVKGTVSAFAERLEAVTVVWTEARVRLQVVEADGKASEGAELDAAEVAGREVNAQAPPTDRGGESVVRGIPFLRGEKVIVRSSLEDRGGTSTPVALSDPVGELIVRVVLPRETPPLELGGGVGRIFGGRKGGHQNLILGDTGALRVTVLRKNGRPAAGVEVTVGGSSAETDKEGVARFQRLAVGHRDVVVSVPGFHTEPAKVWVGAGVESIVEVHQAEGATGEVLVLDAEGTPAPGSLLEVTTPGGVPYCCMDGDTQILGLYTGPAGRCRLPHLPPGPATVRATLGSRSAVGTVEGGGTTEIRLPPVE
jgi:hypothetical protein